MGTLKSWWSERTNLTRRVEILPLVLVLLCCAGCSCEKEEKKAPAPKPVPAESSLPEGVDENLLRQLEEAARSCEKSEARQRVTCSGSAKNVIVLSFNKDERSRPQALPTFVHVLRGNDENDKALAAEILYAAFRTSLGNQPIKIPESLAKDFLDAALGLPDPMAMQVIPAATHAAMLAGKSSELWEKLNAGASVQVRTMAYRYVMVYGRLEAFTHIKKLGTDPGAAIVLSALESPSNMPKWTADERKEICPWALGFLEDERPAVAGNAMAALSHCGGKELDRLLDEVDKYVKEERFSFVQGAALRDICGSSDTRDQVASPEQCEKVRRLQERVSETASIQGRVRAMTLSSLVATWPDEKTRSLVKKLGNDKDADVKRTASQLLTRLERTGSAATNNP